MAYKFRNLPCTILPASKIWAIGGTYYPDYPEKKSSESGILEWCYDEKDATSLLIEMNLDAGFSNLQAFKYQNEEQISNWIKEITEFYSDSQLLGSN